MCGRYTLRTPLQHVVELFGTAINEELLPFAQRFNIAPTQMVPAIRTDASGRRTIDLLRWGLVPGWAEDPSVGNRMINARSETAGSKPAFRDAFRRRRCILPADGFYEWKKEGSRKQPYFIHRSDDEPFGLAGLWERWRRGDDVIESCTILTTSPNPLMRDIHDRMPVILSKEAFDRWLDPNAPPDQLAPLLVPSIDDQLRADPVDTRVNSPKNDDQGCIAASPELFKP
jgi:putative SOS response-associated peptidase YedK